MARLRVLYRDVDRTPYLFTLRRCARRLGLEIDLLSASARDPEWSERLEREEVDVISDNYWRLQLDRARGVPYVAIATASDVFPEKLFVHPSVQSLDDLRGKRFAVRPAGPQLLFPRLWLKDHGLIGDVEQVVYPESETGRWGHWKPVAAGGCHACFITDLYVDAPRQAGLKELPVERYPYADGYITFTTTEGIVERKREALQLLVNAAFAASRLFTTDAASALAVMREESWELLREHFELPDERSLAAVYARLVEGFSAIPVPTAEGIHNAHRLQMGQSSEIDEFNPLLMWDFSFARAALKAGYQKATRAV
jgi:hypothetical protein